MPPILKSPYPWFGGKAAAAPLVWSRLGEVSNYVEPFFGSMALLLGRPHEPRLETVNDKDAYLANFWRALAAEPEAVAKVADRPINEADLEAVHLWLVNEGRARIAAVRTDPDFYDVLVAGRWVWGASCWLGRGWCGAEDGKAPPRGLPMLSNGGAGVHRRSVPELVAYLQALALRMRRVRVCCGDWKRVLTPSATTLQGVTGVVFDPPYAHDTGRDARLYTHEGADIAHDVRAWCLAHGDDPKLRVALCGYAGEHDELELHGWTVEAWDAPAGIANMGTDARENRHRERIWFSPHCLRPTTTSVLAFFEAIAAKGEP